MSPAKTPTSRSRRLFGRSARPVGVRLRSLFRRRRGSSVPAAAGDCFPDPPPGVLSGLIRFCLHNRLPVFLSALLLAAWGAAVAPFDWDLGLLPRDPVPADAIPDLGENQQIVFTEWPGRSPQDVEDQISYPLTSVLLAVPGVKSVRSFSMFGFSSIYVVFEEKIDFYWARTRVLEKLNSLSAEALPDGVRPTLGPDATPLGQVFWYTLEGRDPDGEPVPGWDPQELRTIQDWVARYELTAVPGVAEVASVGGFVREFQVEADPDAMRAAGVSLPMVVKALRDSNLDVGARTLEINRVEYVIRGLGFVKELTDLENAVVTTRDAVPIRVRDVARVVPGPALRRGALDKGGAEAVGGVVVVQYGTNPLAVIKRVAEKIESLQLSLPERTVRVRGPDGEMRETVSKVSIVPFYDRTGLILETLRTLNDALIQQIFVTVIVVVVLLMNLRSSVLISGLLPLAVLMCFIAMRYAGIDANIVALSGIAIAIGTMVDMGIVLNENIIRRLEEAPEHIPTVRVVHHASHEVGSAVMTAVLTTVVSFLPVFTMEAAEGKLFKPLAFTKTFALIASLAVALLLIPPVAYTFFRPSRYTRPRYLLGGLGLAGGVAALILLHSPLLAVVIVVPCAFLTVEPLLPRRLRETVRIGVNLLAAVIVGRFLTHDWMPLGLEAGFARNAIFVYVLIGGLLLAFHLFKVTYPYLLRFFLRFKLPFLAVPVLLSIFGAVIWLGFDRVAGWAPRLFEEDGQAGSVRRSYLWTRAVHAFPGLGREFMPDLDEGAFLLMPTTMPHASIGEAMDVLSKQDMAMEALPEIDIVVGKIGRVDSALDPAPVSMIETVINYKPQYLQDADGARLRYRFAAGEDDLFRNPAGVPLLAPDGEPYTVRGTFSRDDRGDLIPDDDGKPFRLWRPALDPELNPGREAWAGIRSPDDIWDEILRVTELPGTTSAPKLQPIAARLVMLQSGMRAPMGIKVYGKGNVTLEQLEAVGVSMESLLREVPGVKHEAVNAERIVGKPYLELDIDRDAAARYGVNIADVQGIISTAIGGRTVTTVIDGRERYNVLVRYPRELRDSIERLEQVLVPGTEGAQVPLKQILRDRRVSYRRGPQMIKGEDGGLVTYVLFDKETGRAEVEVVEACAAYLKSKIASGELVLPPGVTYRFAGNYENQVRSTRRLMVVLPVALVLIFLILYFQFSSVSTTLMVFSGILVAWAGGFLMIWLYGQSWFCDFSVYGVEMRELFSMQNVNLSVAVWVGFIALFGIATDDGVVMATYLDQAFAAGRPKTRAEIRALVLEAACRRVRPCLMTTATTILALLPVLTATGRGADIMVPMAIPSFGGMCIELMTMFVVPVLYCAREELRR